MTFYGNWCGPYWSAGKLQKSVDDDFPYVDEFDRTCMLHDRVYAQEGDLAEADQQFYESNIGRGPLRTIAGIGVGLQGVFRRAIAPNKITVNNNPMSKQKLRGSNGISNNRKIQAVGVPAAIGYKIQTRAPRIERSATTTRIIGTDFAGTVLGSSSSNYNPAQNVLVNPIYYNGSQLGTLCRGYAEYRAISARLQYIPQVPTTTAGQLVFTANRSVAEPFFSGDTANFLAKVFSQQEAIATPIWESAEMHIPVTQKWRNVDVLINSDIDDTIDYEVQVYAVGAANFICGILLLHYEFEFRQPIYTAHATNIPCDFGGTICTLSDDTDVNATTDMIRLTGATPGFGSWSPGAVFRMVFVQSSSVLPTGPASWGAVASMLSTSTITTAGVGTVSTNNVSMSPGTTVYGKYTGGTIQLYSSAEAAATAAAADGELAYQTATTAKGTWCFLVTAIRLGAGRLITSQ